jgi:hypothetical protein
MLRCWSSSWRRSSSFRFVGHKVLHQFNALFKLCITLGKETHPWDAHGATNPPVAFTANGTAPVLQNMQSFACR